mmetsp:Transcript_5474/g.17519  ORF Transcript_5474/g.17519 Transcript_5474/m.17519 type:complete len:603 (-) Transcript_5474:1903-3711(-)
MPDSTRAATMSAWRVSRSASSSSRSTADMVSVGGRTAGSWPGSAGAGGSGGAFSSSSCFSLSSSSRDCSCPSCSSSLLTRCSALLAACSASLPSRSASCSARVSPLWLASLEASRAACSAWRCSSSSSRADCSSSFLTSTAALMASSVSSCARASAGTTVASSASNTLDVLCDWSPDTSSMPLAAPSTASSPISWLPLSCAISLSTLASARYGPSSETLLLISSSSRCASDTAASAATWMLLASSVVAVDATRFARASATLDSISRSVFSRASSSACFLRSCSSMSLAASPSSCRAVHDAVSLPQGLGSGCSAGGFIPSRSRAYISTRCHISLCISSEAFTPCATRAASRAACSVHSYVASASRASYAARFDAALVCSRRASAAVRLECSGRSSMMAVSNGVFSRARAAAREPARSCVRTSNSAAAPSPAPSSAGTSDSGYSGMASAASIRSSMVALMRVSDTPAGTLTMPLMRSNSGSLRSSTSSTCASARTCSMSGSVWLRSRTTSISAVSTISPASTSRLRASERASRVSTTLAAICLAYSSLSSTSRCSTSYISRAALSAPHAASLICCASSCDRCTARRSAASVDAWLSVTSFIALP